MSSLRLLGWLCSKHDKPLIPSPCSAEDMLQSRMRDMRDKEAEREMAASEAVQWKSRSEDLSAKLSAKEVEVGEMQRQRDEALSEVNNLRVSRAPAAIRRSLATPNPFSWDALPQLLLGERDRIGFEMAQHIQQLQRLVPHDKLPHVPMSGPPLLPMGPGPLPGLPPLGLGFPAIQGPGSFAAPPPPPLAPIGLDAMVTAAVAGPGAAVLPPGGASSVHLSL